MPGWQRVRQCFKITRSRTIKKTGETTTEVAYGITSLDHERANAKELLALNRAHWAIENNLHWVRDWVFREDTSTIRIGAAPQTVTALRNITLSLLKKIDTSPTIAREICMENKNIAINHIIT